jgi:hypothetical protein
MNVNYAKANPVRRSSLVDDLKYDFRSFSTENVRSAVAVDTGRVAEMDMRRRVNCRIECYIGLSHISRAFTVADPGGMGGIHPPHRPQTPRPRKKFVCENSKFFRRFAPIIVQLIKKHIQ